VLGVSYERRSGPSTFARSSRQSPLERPEDSIQVLEEYYGASYERTSSAAEPMR
jgi:hypothetical protein